MIKLKKKTTDFSKSVVLLTKSSFLLSVLVAAFGSVLPVKANAQAFTVLHSFAAGSGPGPLASVILSGNALYGTTFHGGTFTNGSVFKVNTDGAGFTTLHSFEGTDGGNPSVGLTLVDNTLYGAATTVFSLNTDGTGFTTLANAVFVQTGCFEQHPVWDDGWCGRWQWHGVHLLPQVKKTPRIALSESPTRRPTIDPVPGVLKLLSSSKTAAGSAWRATRQGIIGPKATK